MSQTQTIGTHATKVIKDPSTGFKAVRYHDTNVVTFNDVMIILNTGGWRTNTTKTRMNQASNQFNLGYQVYQKDFKWYVDYKGETHEFQENHTYDELILNR